MATACIEWEGARNANGYGVVGSRKVRSRLAHRVAWERSHGPIPAGFQILHRCDNPPCINVDHLFIGTPKSNSDDKIAKGRLRTGRPAHGNKGVHNGSAILSDADVLEIRDDKRSQRAIAREYQISQQTVSDIKRRRRWAWLQP